jgi:tripartite-type tricarboxylate transporter receptor subunit TctC
MRGTGHRTLHKEPLSMCSLYGQQQVRKEITMKPLKILCAWALALAAVSMGDRLATAQTAENFYKSNSLRLIVSAAAGGGYDLYARLLARHMGRHLPNATIVVENMGAAAGLNAANFIYNQAPKDGSVIGALRPTLTFNQLVQPTGVRYDAKKFAWIGSMAQINTVIFLYRPTSPAKSLAEAEEKEVVMGAQAKDDEGYIQTKTMNELVGTKFKIVLGYSGIPAVDLAIRNGEVNGRQGEWNAVKAAHPDWLRENKMVILAQVSIDKIEDLPKVPRIIDLTKNEDDKKLAALVSAPASLGRIIAAPPGVPKDRVEFLRTAFDETMKDPEFLADARKLNLEIQPLAGSDLEVRVNKAVDVPKHLVEKAQVMLK